MLDLNFGDRTEAAERVLAVSVLQRIRQGKVREGPILGHTGKFFYRFDMGNSEDVLTITHSNAKVEVLTFRDADNGKAIWDRQEK